MKKNIVAVVLGCCSIAGLQAGEGAFCKKCEEIREYNKMHHKNYEYYDDYLEAQEDCSKCEAESKKTEPLEK